MKKILLLALVWGSCNDIIAQSSNFPTFRNEALANPEVATKDTEYKLLVYGGANCGFCHVLIKNLHVFDGCKQVQNYVLLGDSMDAVKKDWADYLDKFPFYSNQVLQHRFKKDNEISPLTFLFKGDEQVLYFKGLKKDMLQKIKTEIGCAK
jgi:hypothetical protein